MKKLFYATKNKYKIQNMKDRLKDFEVKLLTPYDIDIEIVKACSQSEPTEKGMIIRVTDEDLLRRTGGILQGMSGSPILQNGKLAGAVTHVFTNDPTQGYGVYIEWILS